MLGDVEQPVDGVLDPLHTVGASRQDEVAVAVHHPGTIVEPLASTHVAPGETSPSSSLGRIQAMVPSTTRRLTPSCGRSDRPSARAPS